MHSKNRNLATLVTALSLCGAAYAGDADRSAGAVVDDAGITASIKTKLIGDNDTKARQINVETRNGVVQLNGFVDTSAARTDAEKIARASDGVKSVENNLQVRTAASSGADKMDDAGITMKVDTALAADKRTSALRVDVETKDGEVQLSGFAKTAAEKSAAEEVAKGVTGVRMVSNKIDVR